MAPPAGAVKPVSRWDLLKGVERLAAKQGGRLARFTLGDCLLELPTFEVRLRRGCRVQALVAERPGSPLPLAGRPERPSRLQGGTADLRKHLVQITLDTGGHIEATRSGEASARGCPRPPAPALACGC